MKILIDCHSKKTPIKLLIKNFFIQLPIALN